MSGSKLTASALFDLSYWKNLFLRLSSDVAFSLRLILASFQVGLVHSVRFTPLSSLHPQPFTSPWPLLCESKYNFFSKWLFAWYFFSQPIIKWDVSICGEFATIKASFSYSNPLSYQMLYPVNSKLYLVTSEIYHDWKWELRMQFTFNLGVP